MKPNHTLLACAVAMTVPAVTLADKTIDNRELYTGQYRVQQEQITDHQYSRQELRLAGRRMFTNPFTKPEGYGDGDDNPPSQTPGSNHEGERGSIQGNGTFQRINGLDAQTCLECHSVISRRTQPMKFGVGGVGGVNNTVLGAGGSTFVDLTTQNKQQNINGRVINPPFIFGAGGIEQLAKEMTRTLNAQLNAAGPGQTVDLVAKGVSFGTVTKDADGNVVVDENGNAVGVEGVFDAHPVVNGVANTDFLVVAPFGRKGDAKSTRTFDIGALSFHFGMQVGPGDADNDGVSNEVTDGELSALSVFVATAQTPFQSKPDHEAHRGQRLLASTGCTACHIPKMETDSKILGFTFPEIGNNPDANVYYSVDLTKAPMHFEENDKGGITVELFADLKRHYMGPSLANFKGDAMFTTMRLWGVADTAPYLHDGRALTIKDAILLHGADPESEAFDAVNNFKGLSVADQNAILAFLDTLRSPDGTNEDLDDLAFKVAKQQGVQPK